jgi:protein TonB
MIPPRPVMWGGIVIAGEQSRRVVVAAVIVAVHAVVLYVLATLGPRLESIAAVVPVTVRFIAESAPQPQLQPPQVKLITPTINTQTPDLPLIEIPVAAPPSDRAITLPASPRSAPAPAADRSAPKLVASVEYLREPSPRYPSQSRKLREQGLVVLRVVIDERGVACDIDIESSSGYSRLDHAAKDAVARAAFRPYIEDGTPRRALVLIPIEFALNRGTA